MRSGGGLLIAPVHCTYSVDVLDTVRDIGKQLGRIETPEGVLGHQGRLPDHGIFVSRLHRRHSFKRLLTLPRAADIPEAQDEYDSYIGKIYGMLIRHEPRHKLVEHLWLIETEYMGLFGNRQRTEATVDRLLSFRGEVETSG